MKMFNKCLLLAASAALLSTTALAADLPVINKAPPYIGTSVMNWTGLGIEGFGLYGVNFTNTDVGAAGGPTLATLGSSPHGPGIGGGLWYLIQMSQGGLVFGARADIAYANMSGGSSLAGSALSISNATNYLGSVDACLGLPLSTDGKLLGYGCGGFGFGGAKPNLQVATLQAAAADTSTGYNAALGLKYALTPNWIVGIEGDYYKLGDKSLTATTAAGVAIATSTTKYDILVQRFVIGYHF